MKRKRLTITVVLGIIVCIAISVPILSRWRYRLDIFQAVRMNSSSDVVRAIRAGQDPNSRDQVGMTPLHYAAYYGFVAPATTLLESGATVDAVDVDGQTPLHKAAWEDKPEMIRFLALRGANVNARDSKGMTPLHEAIWQDARDSAACLLELGADPNIADSKGVPPTLSAVMAGDELALEMLLDHGADPDGVAGHRPLSLAIERDYVSFVTPLLRAGADPDLDDGTGTTARKRAIARGNDKILVALSEWDASPASRRAPTSQSQPGLR